MALDAQINTGNSRVPESTAPNAQLLVALREFREALNDALSSNKFVLTPQLLSADRQAQVLLVRFRHGPFVQGGTPHGRQKIV